MISLKDIYNILRYPIDLCASYKRFSRILFVLILFYKTRLSRLNLVIFSSLFNPFISSSSSIESTSLSLLFSSLSLASSVESLENFIANVNLFIEFFVSEAFANKNEKKKKIKEKEKEKEEKNEKIENNKKKINKNARFRRD